MRKSKPIRRPAAKRRRSRRYSVETLETRVLLSGTFEQQLINAVEAALQPGANSLPAFNTRLQDSSALGSNLTVVGTGLSNYNPGTAISKSLSGISGSYTSLSAL